MWTPLYWGTMAIAVLAHPCLMAHSPAGDLPGAKGLPRALWAAATHAFLLKLRTDLKLLPADPGSYPGLTPY